MKNLKTYINENPYKNYIYSYPHKKAYREFKEEIDLKKLWKNRKTKDLTLYIHIPFCNSKCGYCNLFSTTAVNNEKIIRYVDKLIKEIKAIKEVLQIKEEALFKAVIFGGGTPTILGVNLMEKLLKVLANELSIDFKNVFFSIETSPKTMSIEYMDLLKKYNINRISMGIQSFSSCELKEVYRFEDMGSIEKSLDIIFNEDIEIRNLDLIYGIPSQDIESWKDSLLKVISYKPEEIFIYPLYIREKTKLYNNYKRDFNKMMKMYDIGKELLIKNGYIQTSMRNFIRKDMKNKLYPSYSCQESEMIGIGCGARSYISNVHYSRKYAVNQSNIDNIIEAYLKEGNFYFATYGSVLSEEEIKRKYILKSILKVSGLDINMYFERFGTYPIDDFKELKELIDGAFLEADNSRLYPTEIGIKYSDAIGCLFISDEVNKKVNEFLE